MPPIDISAYTDSPTKQIIGVEIFRSGVHTDSLGREREWKLEELEHLISNFNNGIPALSPLKLGHTSDDHNAQVASELGIPSSILSGEGDTGTGGASLGKVVSLSLTPTGILTATFEAPETVSDLIANGMFNNVSSEIVEDYQGHGPALSGVALLGAERPAVKDLAGLTEVQIMAEKEQLVYTFAIGITKQVKEYDTSQVDALYKFNSEQVFEIPVTQEEFDANGNRKNRTVTVQHIRASTASEARGALIRTLERTATTFGTVVGRGLGIITVQLVAGGVIKYFLGRPQATEAQTRRNIVSGRSILRRIRDLRKIVKLDFAEPSASNIISRWRAGQLTNMQALSALRQSVKGGRTTEGDEFDEIFAAKQLIIDAMNFSSNHTNPFTVGVMVLGAASLAKQLFLFIMKARKSNSEQPIQVWADSEAEAKQLADDAFPDWEILTVAAKAAVSAAFIDQLHDYTHDTHLYDFRNKRTGKLLNPHKHPHGKTRIPLSKRKIIRSVRSIAGRLGKVALIAGKISRRRFSDKAINQVDALHDFVVGNTRPVDPITKRRKKVDQLFNKEPSHAK